MGGKWDEGQELRFKVQGSGAGNQETWGQRPHRGLGNKVS